MSTASPRSVRLSLWWTAVLALVAIAGAGLAVAADRPGNPLERPELTWRADAAARPWIDALAAALESVHGRATDVSTAGRDVLGRLQALDLAGANEALAAGDQAAADITALVAGLHQVRAESAVQVQRWRVGQTTGGLLDVLDGAIAGADRLAGDWADLAADARAVTSLVNALRSHEALIVPATAAAGESRWADASDRVAQAGETLAYAATVRDALAPAASVTTLNDLMARYASHDAALGALYGYLRDGGVPAGATFEALAGAVEVAQAALPQGDSALVAIVGETAGPPVADALLAMEAIHGEINDALVAVDEARAGGPPLAGGAPARAVAP